MRQAENNFLGYLPAITQNSIDLLDKYEALASSIFLVDKELIDIRAIQKDYRALDTGVAIDILRNRYLRLKVAHHGIIDSIITDSDILYMPDDEVTEYLISEYEIPSDKVHLDRTFYRWQRKNIDTKDKIQNTSFIDKIEIENIIEELLRLKSKSLDPWRQVGAVVADQNLEIINGAYNRYLPHDYSGEIDGDVRSNYSKGIKLESSNTIHAETALIADCAKKGISLEGLNIYCSTFPCPTCAKIISQTGINRLYYIEGYTVLDGENILSSNGIEIVQII